MAEINFRAKRKRHGRVSAGDQCWHIYIRLAQICLLFVAVYCPLVVAQTPANRETPSRRAKAADLMQQPEVKRGQQQFSQTCSFCHGAAADGGTQGPSLVLSPVVRHDKHGELIGQVIREGRPGKGMPAFPLSEAQISDIVAFLHARITASDIRSAGKNGSYSLKQLLTGNATAGKVFFEGPGGCTACHSPTGDLAGIATRYAPVELQARFLYPEGAARETVTVSSPSGKTFEGVLLHLDAFTVALQDSDGWYHSWPVSSVKVTVHDPLSTHRKLLETYTNVEMHNVFAYLESLK